MWCVGGGAQQTIGICEHSPAFESLLRTSGSSDGTPSHTPSVAGVAMVCARTSRQCQGLKWVKGGFEQTCRQCSCKPREAEAEAEARVAGQCAACEPDQR